MNRFKFFNNWSKDEKLEAFVSLGNSIKSEINTLEEENTEPIAIGNSYREYKERKNVKGLQTGYRSIDNPNTYSGLHKGSMYVIGAGTGIGKTLVTCNILLSTILNSNVKSLVATTEMPHWAFTSRLWQIWQSMPVKDEENFNSLPIHYIDNRVTITTNLIRNLLEATKYDFLVIDNLQWFSRGGDNVAESIGKATQEFKKIAVEFDLPVLLVSHLNRDVYKSSTPSISQLKGSGYIEQDADGIWLLDRNYDDDPSKNLSPDIIQVYCKKNRLTGTLTNFMLKSDKNNKLMEVANEDYR